jgi:ABC-type sugar transport system substrate-binding protein
MTCVEEGPLGTRIALFLVNDTNEYQQLLRGDGEAAARRAGFDIEVHVAKDEPSQQIRDLHACIRREPDARPRALLVFPVREGSLHKVGQDAGIGGIGWVSLNRHPGYVDDLRRQFPALPIGTVGPDQVEAGRLQGRQALALLPAGGFMLYVMGPTLTSAAQERLAGLKEVLGGSRVKWSEVSGNWHTEPAEEATLGWLRTVLPSGLRLGLVVCQNDAMAIGAHRALDTLAIELGRSELASVPVTGMDGMDKVGKRLVDEGRLAATIVQPSSTGPAVEWLARFFQGAPVPPRIDLPVSSYPEMRRIEEHGRTSG